ncbi:MAG: hypothetical protein HY059_05980 [Proteobacteria bacterium]|nr:hypothetical protein [Pseudomonadota bacterium]
MARALRSTRARSLAIAAIAAAAALAACSASSTLELPPGNVLQLGTWGGDSAGVIATDTLTHVHVGCTYGDIQGRVTVDSLGHFDRAGSFLLRAYPVAVGPTMPARFTGSVHGTTLTMTVTVTDTIAHATVVRGPITAVLGKDPRLGPCPICVVPGRHAAP